MPRDPGPVEDHLERLKALRVDQLLETLNAYGKTVIAALR